MTLRWFISRTVRQANDLCHRVEKILNSQRDVLAPQAIDAVRASIHDLRAAAGQVDPRTLGEQAGPLETVANKWLKPDPNAHRREDCEVGLVVLVLDLGISH